MGVLFCQLVRIKHCEQHKQHIIYNTKECFIPKEAQYQGHWIDHPDIFKAGRIKIDNNMNNQ